MSSSQDLHLVNIKEVEIDEIGRLVNDLKNGEVFFDVGANVGFYTFLASKKVSDSGKVYSFEPSFREYKRLLNGILKNNCSNVIPFNFALSESNGFESILVSDYHTGLNKLRVSSKDYSNSHLCPTFKLDYIVNALNISTIHLLKLDVEGAEMIVLKGMKEILSQKIIKKIVIEITDKYLSDFGNSKTELYDFMKFHSYIPTVNSENWQYDELFILNK